MVSGKVILIIVGAVIALLIGVMYVGSQSNGKNSSEDHNTMGSMSETSSFGKSSEPASNEVLSGVVEMDIKDFAFQKGSIKVKKGTEVKWTNQDSTKHDVTPDNDNEAFHASELLAQGESYSWKFDKVGMYNYFCSPHPYMKGMIEVVE
jgi:plastocyanin